MNFSFATSSPYVQAAMSQAVQSILNGGSLPPNCLVMSVPIQQIQQLLPQLMMNTAFAANDPKIFPQQVPYLKPSPYTNNAQARGVIPQPNYNFPIISYKSHNQRNKKAKKPNQQQPHSNVYNSSSFDSYMRHLSWSRLFDHHSKKTSKPEKQDEKQINYDKKSNSSSSSSSSATSDETIRRVNVNDKQSSNIDPKQPTKGSLPFKYSSEFVPGAGQQQSQNTKSDEVFVVKQP